MRLTGCYNVPMKSGTRNGTRRTTLTLPVNALAAAERIARARKANLSVVVSEALEEKFHAEAEDEQEGERRVKAWEARCKSHASLTEEEWMLLDGIILSEPVDEES
jgi:hypothetical protein